VRGNAAEEEDAIQFTPEREKKKSPKKKHSPYCPNEENLKERI